MKYLRQTKYDNCEQRYRVPELKNYNMCDGLKNNSLEVFFFWGGGGGILKKIFIFLWGTGNILGL